MKEKVFQFTVYAYMTFSYSGIAPGESFIHKTREGAEAHARELGLKVVEYCNDADKEATIEEVDLLD